MEIKWFMIALIGIALAGGLATSLTYMAAAQVGVACVSQNMEWVKGDCIEKATK